MNVWLALLVRPHVHHSLAVRWFDGLPAGGAGLCRVVQLSVVRLLSSAKVLGTDAVPARAAWERTEQLLLDERVVFQREPTGIENAMMTLLRYPVPTSKQVADAYLAAFAMALSSPVVTLDAGFDRFDGLRQIRLR